jgi:hypothetical protein
MSNRGKKDINGKRGHNPEQKNNNTVEFGHEFGDVNASKLYEAKVATEAEKQKVKGAKEKSNG